MSRSLRTASWGEARIDYAPSNTTTSNNYHLFLASVSLLERGPGSARPCPSRTNANLAHHRHAECDLRARRLCTTDLDNNVIHTRVFENYFMHACPTTAQH